MAMAMATAFIPLISYRAKAAANTEKEELITTLCNRGRRQLLLLSSTATATAILADSRTDLLNGYLKKSQENKAKNDKERLDSYYKRNYRDYFGSLEGDLKQKKDLSESEKGILDWLGKNK